MIPDYINIEVGQLYIVDKPFWTSGDTSEYGNNIKRKMAKGDIIEIRYPYEWHFRTVNNQYDHARTKTLAKYCTFYGKIHENVRFNNGRKLSEILAEELYIKAKDHSLVANKVVTNDNN